MSYSQSDIKFLLKGCGLILGVGLLLISIPFIVLVCQSESTVHQGVVVSKKHDEAHTTMITIVGYKGATTVVPQFHPEAWTIRIRGLNEDEETEYRTLDVSQEEYGFIKKGELYVVKRGEEKE